MLKNGDTIMFSDSALVLERIIGKIVTDKLSE